MGDYKVLEKFKTENDIEWAEKLLEKIAGPTMRQKASIETANNQDVLPRHQGVGFSRLNSARRSLNSSFAGVETTEAVVETTDTVAVVETTDTVDAVEITDTDAVMENAETMETDDNYDYETTDTVAVMETKRV